MEKRFKREGILIGRSSLCDLFHQAAAATKPIWQEILNSIPKEPLVLADETSMPIMDNKKTKKGYMWAFLLSFGVLYFFSRSRSGNIASKILDSSEGILLTDAYAGYNAACKNARVRAGCWAHVRRKFFDAKTYASKEAEYALDQILDLYRIEREANRLNTLGTKEHLSMRQERAPPILDNFEKWLKSEKEKHLPKGPMGKAISYALDNWQELKVFLTEAKVPLDNNASERALRSIALGRKNYLFAGNDEAAQNLAGLYSLVATCEMHGVNPEKYLADVLIRVHTHKAKDVGDLLPHRWKEIFSAI